MAAFKHSTKDPDLPNYFDAMSGDNSEDYCDAMKGEVEALTKRETWELVDRSSVGSTASVIPDTFIGHFDASDALMVASENSKHDTV